MDRAKRCRWLIGLSLTLLGNLVLADWSDINMTRGVTEISRQVYQLHMIMFTVCVVIGVIVFSVMVYSMYKHRKSLGAVPATFHEDTRIETFWTVFPVLILVGLAIPATSTLRSMYDASGSDVDIKIVGYQWKWQYTYLDDDPGKEVQFMSSLLTPQDEIQNRAEKREQYLLDVDNQMVIPGKKRGRVRSTSNDVIHSWWIPEFAVKKDAIPGFVHETWTVVEEPGVYRGQCAELCGKDHGFMPIVVRAVEQTEYDSWLSEKQEEARVAYETVGKEWTLDELVESGEQVYTQNCVTCHQANGQGIPPAFPSLVGRGTSVGPMDVHIQMVLNGKAGTSMQAFSVQLNAAQLAAVITYERNAWGNDMRDLVQPRDINELLTAGQ